MTFAHGEDPRGAVPPPLIRRLLAGLLGRPAGRAALEDLDREYRLRTGARNDEPAPFWYGWEGIKLLVHFNLVTPLAGAGRGHRSGGAGMMDGMMQTVRQVGRMLRHSPGFAFLSVLTMALGIGATVAVFTVVNTVILNPLPYDSPDELVALFEAHPQRDIWDNVANPGNARGWEEASTMLADFSFTSMQFPLTITGIDQPTEIQGHYAAPDFFQMLGVDPELGRHFSPEAGIENNEMLISHAFWAEQFGSDPAVVGTTLLVNGETVEIVGVMPVAHVPFGTGAQAWIGNPLLRANQENSGRYIYPVGRLAEGVTPERLQEEMTVIAQGLEETFPDLNGGWTVSVVPLTETILGDVRGLLWILLGAVGLLLFIASANVASLHLVRATERQHEMAIRTAIGASGGHLGRQLLAESLTLAALGAAGGIILARYGVTLAAGELSAAFALPRLAELGVDGRVVAFAVGVTAMTGLLFGLIPAIQAGRVPAATVLSAEARGPSRRAGRLRNGLVVMEVALSLVLLVSAGLVARSFSALMAVDTGIDPRGVLTARINASGDGQEREAHVQFFQEIQDRVSALPGVEAAGLATFLPMNGPTSATGYWPGELPEPDMEDQTAAQVLGVEGQYFQAMGVPVVAGRLFQSTDRPVVGGHHHGGGGRGG
jgi:predicted permease